MSYNKKLAISISEQIKNDDGILHSLSFTNEELDELLTCIRMYIAFKQEAITAIEADAIKNNINIALYAIYSYFNVKVTYKKRNEVQISLLSFLVIHYTNLSSYIDRFVYKIETSNDMPVNLIRKNLLLDVHCKEVLSNIFTLISNDEQLNLLWVNTFDPKNPATKKYVNKPISMPFAYNYLIKSHYADSLCLLSVIKATFVDWLWNYNDNSILHDTLEVIQRQNMQSATMDICYILTNSNIKMSFDMLSTIFGRLVSIGIPQEKIQIIIGYFLKQYMFGHKVGDILFAVIIPHLNNTCAILFFNYIKHVYINNNSVPSFYTSPTLRVLPRNFIFSGSTQIHNDLINLIIELKYNDIDPNIFQFINAQETMASVPFHHMDNLSIKNMQKIPNLHTSNTKFITRLFITHNIKKNIYGIDTLDINNIVILTVKEFGNILLNIDKYDKTTTDVIMSILCTITNFKLISEFLTSPDNHLFYPIHGDFTLPQQQIVDFYTKNKRVLTGGYNVQLYDNQIANIDKLPITLDGTTDVCDNLYSFMVNLAEINKNTWVYINQQSCFQNDKQVDDGGPLKGFAQELKMELLNRGLLVNKKSCHLN